MTDPPPRTGDSQQGASETTVRAMRALLHVITGVLLAVGTARAIVTGGPAVATVVLAAAFLAWYIVGVVLSARVRDGSARGRLAATGWLLGLALIWAGMLAVSAEFVWLAFSLWLLAGFLLSGATAVVFALAVLAATVLAPLAHGRPLTAGDVVGPLIGGLFAFGIARGYVALTREARERERLVASLVAAQAESSRLQDELAAVQRRSGAIAERARLSRDIHDTIAQGLSSILLLARTKAATPGDSTLDRIETLAQEGLDDVRRIVAELAPAELDEQALPGALRRMLARLADETAVSTQLQVDEDFPVLPTPVEVALLRTAQSALANVRQHSGATRVVVSLSAWGEGVRMDIVDDGVGFDPAAVPGPPNSPGYGLRAIAERLRELGGGLDVESAPGDGSRPVGAHSAPRRGGLRCRRRC